MFIRGFGRSMGLGVVSRATQQRRLFYNKEASFFTVIILVSLIPSIKRLGIMSQKKSGKYCF